MAPDKRKTNNQRFYLWDYLWWQGNNGKGHDLSAQYAIADGCTAAPELYGG